MPKQDTTYAGEVADTIDGPRTVDGAISDRPIQIVVAQRPIFIRLPKDSECCPWSGLTRTTIYDLINARKIKSASLRVKGGAAKKGTRVILLQSLLDYLHSEVEKTESSRTEDTGQEEIKAKGRTASKVARATCKAA